MSYKSVNEIFKGFFWGLGFAISVFGIGTVYTMHMAASVDLALQQSLSVKARESFDELEQHYDVKLSEIFKQSGQVKITAELTNITNEEVYAVGIAASTFDVNDRFIGNCLGQGTAKTLQPEEVSYIEIRCDFFKTQAARVHSVKLSPAWM